MGSAAACQSQTPPWPPYEADGKNVVKRACLLVRHVLQARLMDEWWDTHPEAGSREGLMSPIGDSVPLPALRLCTWVRDVPVVPEEARQRFAVGSEQAEQWLRIEKNFQDVFGRPAEESSASPVSARQSTAHEGPDFAGGGGRQPVDTQALWEPAECEEPTDPNAVSQSKDGVLRLFLTDTQGVVATLAEHVDQTTDVDACELLGFGLGAYETVEANSPDGLSSLACRVPDDATFVARVPEDAVAPKTARQPRCDLSFRGAPRRHPRHCPPEPHHDPARGFLPSLRHGAAG